MHDKISRITTERIEMVPRFQISGGKRKSEKTQDKTNKQKTQSLQRSLNEGRGEAKKKMGTIKLHSKMVGVNKIYH